MSDGSDFPAGLNETQQASVRLARSLRRFLDLAAALGEESDDVASLVAEVDRLSDGLEGSSVPEERAVWRKASPYAPTALLPAYSYSVVGDRLEGKVRFGRFHVGRAAAHGGAISLFFDELLGLLVYTLGGRGARTAYLHTDFRSLTPLDRDLYASAWLERAEGRKRYVRAVVRDGDVICAEAHGLWVDPRS